MLKAEVAKTGAQFVAEEYYERSAKDFGPALLRIIAQKRDLIETGGSPTGSIALIAKQARELGFQGYSLNPGMGLDVILMSFLIIIVGGLGSITGTVLAGLLVGVIESAGAVLFGSEAAYGLVFLVMIAVLVVRPAGLLGSAAR